MASHELEIDDPQNRLLFALLFLRIDAGRTLSLHE
jgi:hypothetical protein